MHSVMGEVGANGFQDSNIVLAMNSNPWWLYNKSFGLWERQKKIENKKTTRIFNSSISFEGFSASQLTFIVNHLLK